MTTESLVTNIATATVRNPSTTDFMVDGMAPNGTYRITFKDSKGVVCYLQDSSSAYPDAIWFGCLEPNPRMPNGVCGYSPLTLPKDVAMDTSMHLTVEQVKMLIPVLQKFVDTGSL